MALSKDFWGADVDALTSTHPDPTKLVSLCAVKAQLGLFASRSTIDRADEVLRFIIDTYYQPNLDSGSRDAVTNGTHDFLKPFTPVAQKEASDCESGNAVTGWGLCRSLWLTLVSIFRTALEAKNLVLRRQIN